MTNKIQKLTKRQFRDLLASHVGVGVMHYKSDENCVSSIFFCVGKGGQIIHVQNGAPIEMTLNEEDSEQRTIKISAHVV